MVIMEKKKQKKFDIRLCLDRIDYLESLSSFNLDDEYERVYCCALRKVRQIILECIVDASGLDGTLLEVVAYGD